MIKAAFVDLYKNLNTPLDYHGSSDVEDDHKPSDNYTDSYPAHATTSANVKTIENNAATAAAAADDDDDVDEYDHPQHAERNHAAASRDVMPASDNHNPFHMSMSELFPGLDELKELKGDVLMGMEHDDSSEEMAVEEELHRVTGHLHFDDDEDDEPQRGESFRIQGVHRKEQTWETLLNELDEKYNMNTLNAYSRETYEHSHGLLFTLSFEQRDEIDRVTRIIDEILNVDMDQRQDQDQAIIEQHNDIKQIDKSITTSTDEAVNDLTLLIGRLCSGEMRTRDALHQVRGILLNACISLTRIALEAALSITRVTDADDETNSTANRTDKESIDPVIYARNMRHMYDLFTKQLLILTNNAVDCIELCCEVDQAHGETRMSAHCSTIYQDGKMITQTWKDILKCTKPLLLAHATANPHVMDPP